MHHPEKRTYQKSNFSTEKVIGKKLPSHIEAEKSVLGALLLNDENLTKISEILTPQDFYIPAHTAIYGAIVEIAQRMERLDIVTLQNELEKKGALDNVGGLMYLLSLQEDIPSVGLIEQHAKIVKEKSVLRELINSATTIITSCYNQDQDDISTI